MLAELVILMASALALSACGFLAGVRSGRQDADLAVRYLRADNTRLRSRLVATERELDAERSRRAPVLRVIRGSRSGSDEAS